MAAYGPIARLIAIAAALGALGAAPAAVAHEKVRAVREACVKAPREGPGDVVRALYAKYWMDEVRPSRKPIWNETREVVSRYFDAKVTERFLADQACQAKWQAPCDFTVNILCGCQGGEPTDLRFCRSTRGPEWVEVRFMIFSGRKFKEEKTLSFLTSRTAAGWRISDIEYAEGESLIREP